MTRDRGEPGAAPARGGGSRSHNVRCEVRGEIASARRLGAFAARLRGSRSSAPEEPAIRKLRVWSRNRTVRLLGKKPCHSPLGGLTSAVGVLAASRRRVIRESSEYPLAAILSRFAVGQAGEPCPSRSPTIRSAPPTLSPIRR